MSRARQPPLVTGISPKEGTSWTKVTIRGENLGTGPSDLIGLTICGHNCLLTAEWISASKIVCRVGQDKNDKGDIIVTTKSGGKGTSTVFFKLLKPEKIGILEQSAVWVDEMNYYDMRTDRNKGLSPLSQRPANPLGIDIDRGKVPHKNIETLFPGMSFDFNSEKFSATWYLIENHSSASFEQLKIAANNLRKQASKKNEGNVAYVKGGLSTFFEAQDALAAIHQKLEVDGTEKVEGSMTQKLEKVLKSASTTADTLFQEVLGRKDKADSTRNALNVLQRFKFLFNLPLNIEKNIQKGDYDVVINDYEKAKSLFGKTEVQVFKKVYSEVETRIEALRKLLLDKLLETPSTLHDQKRYIRYLSDLHAPGDPAWQCIGAQHKWIVQLMHSCKEDYVKELKGNPMLQSPFLDMDNDGRPSPIGRLSQTASLQRGSSFQSGRNDTWRSKSPHQVAFVEKLTKVVVGQLPNFWKLWISYVNGSIFSETAEKSGQMEKSKKNARQRQNDFKKMIQEVMQTLVKLIRGALLPSSLGEEERRYYGGWDLKSDLSGSWITQVIQTVRLSYESLTALEIPNDLLQTIQDMILDLRVHCVIVTLKQTTEEVKRLADKEDWIVDNEGLTSLPTLFEQCVVHSLQSLKPVIECKPGEASIFQQQKVQDDMCQLCIRLIQVFIASLENLSTKPEGNMDTMHISLDVSSPDLFGSIHEDLTISPEKRLLIVLSNCRYLERHTLLNIAEHFEKHGFQGIEKITKASTGSLRDLDQMLFETFIEIKTDPIVGSLEPGIYAGYFDWRDCQTPTGVRNYLKEALVNIIAVHAEVFAISKELVPRVMSKIVEAVGEELSRLMQCVSSFSRNGALQARLEICALRDTVAVYLTNDSKSSFKQALEALPQLPSGSDKKLLEELLNEFKSSMHLQLTCFQPSSSVSMKT
ncbi:exocyst complex component 2 [Spea bombifrons]|uniref:exocyst complex component 2 n=1 Tax=Spea bombifrons TaxID=233779 RepID=UPI00234B71D3|nr:exocyst complex component 2 [Spea bombifrons]XP_053322066.1 exocyst complex component 2 [Spea bombifrons]